MSKRMWLALSAFVASFSVQAADEPQWLKDARAREGKMGLPSAIKSKDNWFKAKLPAKLIGEIEKVEGSYTVELNIGSDQSAYCEIMPEGFDMADMIRSNLEFTMEQVAKGQGKIEVRALEATDAGVFGNVPYLQTQWVYRVNDGKAQLLGGFQQISMEKNGQGIYCAHVDIGYTKTFFAVAKAFAETFESASDEPAPFYEEIAVTTIGGRKLGISRTTLDRDEEGDIKVTDTSAMLSPVANGVLHSDDTIRLEWVRPDYSLINATRFVAKNGALTTNLNLKFVDKAWIVDGDHDGKKLNHKLKGDGQPGTSLAQAVGLRKILAASDPIGSQQTMWSWLGSAPDTLVETNTKITAKAGDKKFKGVANLEGINADVIIDQVSGTVAFAEVKTNGIEMTFERVYARGTF
jgi:hypothetical protein